jgi:hypothetical protein
MRDEGWGPGFRVGRVRNKAFVNPWAWYLAFIRHGLEFLARVPDLGFRVSNFRQGGFMCGE